LAHLLYILKCMKPNTQKKYDLEERTFLFSKNVYAYVKLLSKTLTNVEIGKQLVRSAGSVGANYIEANEALSKKDFLMRAKICRKEAKESRYWLKLSDPNTDNIQIKNELIMESFELTKIFGSIVTKSS